MALDYLEPKVDVERRNDGTIILSSPYFLAPAERQLGSYMRHWAAVAPERTFLAVREGEDWQTLSFAAARAQTDAISQGLLDRGLNADRPVMILSGNSLQHAMLTYGAMQVGVSVAPVSPAYSLMSQDFAKLQHIFDLVQPALIYVENPSPFAKALDSLDLDGVEVLDHDGLQALSTTQPGGDVEAAFAAVGPDTVAKYFFTSGSTGLPKGVINTQGMLCSNMQQLRQVWPFLLDQPPIMIDWLPWNHTFGGNIVINNAMCNGGTLYVDDVIASDTYTIALATQSTAAVWNRLHFLPSGLGFQMRFVNSMISGDELQSLVEVNSKRPSRGSDHDVLGPKSTILNQNRTSDPENVWPVRTKEGNSS